MKTLIIAIFFTLSPFAQAGDKIGNGGGIWTCTSNKGDLIRAQLVDLFEAQYEFGLQVPPAPNLIAQDIAKQKAFILHNKNNVLTEKINFHLNEVLKKARFVNAVLQKIDDALYRIVPLPNTCPEGQWEYVQFANFTTQDQVLIRNDFWTSPVVSELDKGALLLHEAVYRWLRLENKDDNSIRAREIVGLLFSDLNLDEINRRIQTLLAPITPPTLSETWACTLMNRHNNSFYLAFGESNLEAKTKVIQACENAPNGFFCTLPNSPAPECEEATSNSNVWTCNVNNENISKNFLGKGKTLPEAQYNARQSCSNSSNGGFFCQVATCSRRDNQAIKPSTKEVGLPL